MEIKKLRVFDCFSPTITLHYKNNLSHNSVFSGVLSIIHYFVFLVVFVYYLYLIFSSRVLSSSIFKQSIEEEERFELDKENFDHKIVINGLKIFDEKAISVIGMQNSVNQNLETEIKDFWKYQPCEEENSYSLCLKEFFNYTEKRKYLVTDRNFKYPAILQRNQQNSTVPYSIKISYCMNSISNNSCYEKGKADEIVSTITSIGITFNDKLVDIGTFSDSFLRYINLFGINSRTTELQATNVFFVPNIVESERGLFFSKTEQKGYVFDKVLYNSYNLEKNDTIGLLTFWLSHQVYVYKVSYFGVLDVLPNIIALTEVSWYFFFLINYYINKYVTYNDFGVSYQKNYARLFKSLGNVNNQNPPPLGRAETYASQKSTNNIPQVAPKLRRAKSDISMFSFYKQWQYTLKKLVLHLLKYKKSRFIEALIKLRCRALDEEKLIKYHLYFSFVDTHCCLFYDKSIRSTSKTYIQGVMEAELSRKVPTENKIALDNSSSSQNELVKKQNNNFIKDNLS